MYYPNFKFFAIEYFLCILDTLPDFILFIKWAIILLVNIVPESLIYSASSLPPPQPLAEVVNASGRLVTGFASAKLLIVKILRK